MHCRVLPAEGTAPSSHCEMRLNIYHLIFFKFIKLKQIIHRMRQNNDLTHKQNLRPTVNSRCTKKTKLKYYNISMIIISVSVFI